MAKRKAIVLSDDLSKAKMTSLLQSLKRRKIYRKKRRTGVSALARLPKISRDPFPREWRTKLTWNPDTAYLAPYRDWETDRKSVV